MDEIYQQTLHIEDKIGSLQQFREYLRNQGYKLLTDDKAVHPNWPLERKGGSSEDVSTDKLYKSDLDTNLTYTLGDRGL